MLLSELKNQLLEKIHDSWLLKGVAFGVAGIIILFIILAALLGMVILLHRFFIQHPVITRARRILAYLLTMVGVIALVIGGLLGLILPIIPGIALLLAGFLLLRKYHKFVWIELKIKHFKKQMRKLRNKKINKNTKENLNKQKSTLKKRR